MVAVVWGVQSAPLADAGAGERAGGELVSSGGRSNIKRPSRRTWRDAQGAAIERARSTISSSLRASQPAGGHRLRGRGRDRRPKARRARFAGEHRLSAAHDFLPERHADRVVVRAGRQAGRGRRRRQRHARARVATAAGQRHHGRADGLLRPRLRRRGRRSTSGKARRRFPDGAIPPR